MKRTCTSCTNIVNKRVKVEKDGLQDVVKERDFTFEEMGALAEGDIDILVHMVSGWLHKYTKHGVYQQGRDDGKIIAHTKFRRTFELLVWKLCVRSFGVKSQKDGHSVKMADIDRFFIIIMGVAEMDALINEILNKAKKL